MPWILPIAQLHGAGAPSLFETFWRDSGAMSKVVFLILIGMSIGSWAIMIGKALRFRRQGHDTRDFLEAFRESQRFSEVNEAAADLTASPLVGLFQAGYVEIDAQIKAARAASESGYRMKSLDGLQRTLRRALGVEQKMLSRGTGFLATTAAASPFIGLFGTVWGIMIAFQDIGLTGSTSLATVAPGIAEALVNTAAGLGAAIPALVGFNYFSNEIRQVRAEMEDFVLDFLNLAERNFT